MASSCGLRAHAGTFFCKFSSVQFSSSVVSDSLQPHESQHPRPPCSSPTPRVHSDSRPSSQWYHPAISSYAVPFSFCPQSLPASESFPMSQLSTWGGQSTRVSASASFLPKKSQGWSPSEWTGWISLQSKGLSRVFSNTTVQPLNSPKLSLYLHKFCTLSTKANIRLINFRSTSKPYSFLQNQSLAWSLVQSTLAIMFGKLLWNFKIYDIIF